MTTPAGNDSSALFRVEGHAQDQSRMYLAGRDLYQTTFSGPPPTPVTALHTLPRDVVAFTGRDSELRRLLRTADTRAAEVLAIHTIDGMPGVGKTALVTHAAHLLADRYPDGQLFVHLAAHTSGQPPADPAEVLAALLLGAGVAPQHIPDGVEARAALWRARLAGKRVLLVLDDAASRTQIEPLLPSSGGCLVLITSRRRLLALDGTVPLPLETLPPKQATALFTRLIHRNVTEKESEAAAEVVKLCGYLPLAIRLLAAHLAHHPTWDIATYAHEFATAQDLLGELEAGDRAVTAAFDLSYHALSADQQRLFRRLCLHPGPEIGTYAAAALDDLSLAQARRRLNALYTDHFIDEPAPGRYRMHDLIREYALALAAGDPDDDRQYAIIRLYAYYQRVAQVAKYFFSFPRPEAAADEAPVPIAELVNREQALAWVRTERPNLIACVNYAALHRQHTRVIQLTDAMSSFPSEENHWQEDISLYEKALTAARHSGDRLAQANALRHLCWTQLSGGQYSAPADLAEQALALYRSIGHQHGEANALHALCHTRRLTGRYEAATDLAEQALTLHKSLGDRHGEAKGLLALAWLRRVATAEYEAATALAEQALALYKSLEHQIGEASALCELRVIRQLSGEYDAAADLAGKALVLYRNLGNRYGEALALQGLSRAQEAIGDYEAAADFAEQALALYRTLGDRHGEAEGLQALGKVRLATGDHETAAVLAEQALAIYRALNFGHGEANALHALAQTRYLSGAFETATELLAQARALFQSFGDDHGEAEVLNSTGALLAQSSGPAESLVAYRQALQLARRAQAPLEEAKALEGVARTQMRCGQRQAALDGLRVAVAIYQRIGAAEAESALAHLASLQNRAFSRSPGQP
ncbi:tetratricopeptide repeat protein [Streptomyces kasugaensis]|uniref:Tetratricopeptide repeat protein n=1 Tax=Streptomyces kasugaensis TaxID=1946 RepID=A0A4Q9HXB9_STRKA|nr:tetratricopeptide repeat protein [Streptomyces kasugaensis]TBO59938.1 tetratricopeptide repeat protein [Streptomyces kasugaensis]